MLAAWSASQHDRFFCMSAGAGALPVTTGMFGVQLDNK
jgi:hypothetical protein